MDEKILNEIMGVICKVSKRTLYGSEYLDTKIIIKSILDTEIPLLKNKINILMDALNDIKQNTVEGYTRNVASECIKHIKEDG